jgi:hypothetical protein
MSNICFNLNNTIDISNNYYIFNNVNGVIGDFLDGELLKKTNYGLYETSGNKIYSIQNIPKTHPIGFYDASDTNAIVDISHLIQYDVSYGESINIYVSKGSDLSFTNNNYYRFYDECYNLLNISGSLIETGLTNSGDNFYFMRSMKYTFIAMEDFSTSHPFALSGEDLSGLSNDLSLQKIDDSFNIIIPKTANNTTNRIFYVDDTQNDISGELSILIDASNISYYYGDISLTVDGSFETHFNTNKLSIKSFPLNGIQEVSNTNIFVYDTTCDYVLQQVSQFVNILFAQGKECLNIVSEAKLETSANNISYYEFNLNNHGRVDVSNELLYSLDYGLYDGSYTIFNIDENYPFTIVNNDFSNAIYVDEENTTGILHRSDPKIQILGDPLNTYNFYYGTVRIKLDNSAGTFIQNSLIPIQILNIPNNFSYEPSNNFVYTEFCNDPDDVNNITFRDVSFVLFNQQDLPFVVNDFSAVTDNIYYLNLYQTYEEPIIPYAAIDRYNHDISYLVRSTAPVQTTLGDGTVLDNTFQINYDLSYFIITYTLEDYEKTTVQLLRLVEIRRGPYIEISGNYEIFHNSNPFTNRIDISTNTFESSLNFFENLDVFLYDNSGNKINLPFEITVSGEFFSPTSLNDQLVLDNLTGSSKKVLKYENINLLDGPFEFESDYTDFSLNYYLSKNFNFNFLTGSSIQIDEVGLKIFDISNIRFSDGNSPILSVGNLLHINDEDVNNSYRNFIIDPLQTKINSLFLDGESLIINRVDNSLNIIDVSQNYNDLANNTNYELNTSIKITTSDFLISISDINESTNNFYIEGSFNPINFFSSTHIDTQFIGNYEIIVDIKGLSNEDFLFNDLSNILDLNSLILDFSRTFLVNVLDNVVVELNFVNQNVVSPNPLLYEYQYSRDFSFNIFTDISFFKQGDAYLENTNIPLLELSDNSIYDGSLSFLLYQVSNITAIYDNGYFIQATNPASSAEAIIVYTAKDLCGNVSNDVSLNITFTDTPLLTLSGSRTEIISVHSAFNEPGLLIKGDIGSGVQEVTYVPSTGPYSVNFSSNYTTTTDDPAGYDISWGLVLDISTIGLYELTYEVRKTGKTDTIYIKRFIEVTDISNPFFRFPDLSNIAYIDGSNDASFVSAKDILFNNTFENTFNIDFSLTVFSTFDDLSFIINQFEVSDNYFDYSDLSTIITLSISGEGDISFNETGLRNVFSSNNGYLNSDNCLNKVTIGLNEIEPLRFNYNVIDACDNSFNITRIVDIVDKSVPSIDFSFDFTSETDLSFALFASDFKDFSYMAFNYLKDASLLIFELSSIIFDFSLIDNYEIVNSNYVITISGITNNYKQENIKTIADISNDISSIDLFSKVDTSLVIIYEISDNQYNDISINRKVDIINSIDPSINFINNYGFDDRIHINFGDKTYDLLLDFSLSHPRVFSSDISFDLSYILPPHTTSLSGHVEYDPSAIIYSVSGDISSVHYDINFYSVTLQNPFDLSSDVINIKLIINNTGPSFNEIPYINIGDLSSINVIHEAGEILTDASFILGVNAFSEFDKFYYRNYHSDISYLSTNFQIGYDTSFIIDNPTVGFFTISYEAVDRNNQVAILERLILIVDTQPPIISISLDVINIDQFEELNMPSAFFEDRGSDLSRIEVDLSNTSNAITTDLSNISLVLTPSETYNFTSSELILNSNDTSNGTISYQIRYRAFDRFNNLSEKFVTVNISQTTNFVITPKISISGYEFDLNLNFNSNFYNLINTDTANLSTIFDVSDIAYDAFNKTVTYEVKKLQFFNLLDFSMHARYINDNIPDYNNTVINNILGFTLGTYKVLFQSFNSSNFESLVEVIDFTIVDTSPPDLSYVLSLDYEDISNIQIPLLSFDTYETLKTNPNYLENNNLFNPYYFTRDNTGNAMFSIPGIHIVDILGGVAQSLSNETLPSIFDSSLSLFVTYVKDLSSGSFTINQDTSINFTQINQATEVVTINPNLKDSAINVLIDHADVNPGGYAYTKFTYLDGTVHEFRHRGNSARQFYNSTSNSWSGYYGLGDHSASVRTHTGNTSKNYLIECTVIVGVSTWTFRALDGGVSEVELKEDSAWRGLLQVEVKDIPIFDISTGYLLLNNGSYVQNYRAFDAAGNFSDISRSISVERLQPFINLNYTQDVNRNIFLKTYHQQFTAFIDPLGRAYDYYLGELTGNAIQTVQALPEDDLGIHTVKYQLENYPTTTAEREVHVVNIKCLPITTDGLNNLITEGINFKYGLYNDKYRINIFDSSNAIRVFGYNYDYSYNVDISNLISICGENIVSYGGYEYHWGEVDLSVNGNFNRANIEYLNSDLSKIILEDIFLYTEECFQILINELLNKPLPSDSFRVDVSGYNDEDISYQFFTLSGELYPEFNDEKQHYITDLSRANLHLAMGKYTFVQDTEKNFYNRIKFSLTQDGTHNGGKEFTRGVKEYGLPGLSGGYTELIVSITTPSPLYYYSEHFPNMGGKIETRNNLVITAGNIYVNDNILTVDNSLVLQSFNSEEELLNRIILKQAFDISGSDVSYSNMHFNCITQQNINHNLLVHKDKNLLIFKKYQSSPNYDPVAEGVVSYVPSYDISNIYTNTHGDISNQNLLHDISNHYLFDCSVNQYQSYVFQYDYTIDTSANILANLSINTLTEELAVAVGSGTDHTIAFSIDGGANWTGVGKSALDISGLGIGYNGTSRFVAVGSGSNNTIVYSDNGVNWFSSIDSKLIFDEYAKAVVYDNSNSYWLVGGKGSVNTLAYSSKGINWVGLGKTVFETRVNGFSKHNGSYILALGDGTNNSIAYSSDGLNWNGGTSNGGGNTKITFSVQGNSAVYYENQNLWLAVGEGRLNSIAYSTNGIDWVGLGKTRIDEGRDIDANDTMVIIVGKKYTTGNYSAIIYSYDGIVWYSSETDIFTECNSIVWTGSLWIATGLGPTTRIATSRNGKEWLTIDNTINLFSGVGNGVEGFTRNTLLRDASDILYQMNILDLFYTNNEIDNYSYYFRKNRLLSSRLVTSNFVSKINELRYVNHVSLIDDNQIFDYFLEKYLTSSRIVFSHILDNFITFNLQTYIDLSNLDINRDLLNILYNEHFPLYDTSTNYVVNNSNLLFDEFVVNIWSDICGELPVIIKTEEESILLSNGLIELNEYLLDSKDSSGVLYKVYDDVINSQGLDYVNNELKNNVFLSVRDISMIGHDYNQYIGLTLQNIHHNMYIDESDVLIFHSYQNLTNNFKVNEPTLTLEKTIRDFSNNKNYLLELSSNDVYGCFVDNSKNIYENSNTKNSVIRQDPINYKSFVAYFFDNELGNNDDYLSQFDIRPISQNDICYNLYPYSYDSSLQTFHSHSYLIDLNDYFDRYIYDNSNLEVPYNVYNKSNLFYTIVDVSYLNEFNIFDVRANQNIIYDKSKIEILNYLQNFLVILNFKLDFVYDILSSNILYNNIPYSYDPGDYQFINDTNIQDLNTLYNSINFISTNYELSLPNNSLNKLFANNFYNTKQIKEKYLRLEQIFTYHQNNDYVNLTENAYDNIQNFNNVDQLATDISNINLNIDNILNNNLYYFYNQDVIEQLIKQTGYSAINNYGDLDLLHNLFLHFNRIKKDYDNIIFEFNARHLNESLFSAVNIIDYSFVDLYDISLINNFTLQLLNNFVSLDQVLRNQVQHSNIYIDTGGGTNNIPDTGFSYTYNQANVGLTDLSNATNFILNNYNYFLDSVSRNYDFINKERIYDDINYFMSGSKILVNSFYSNNLEIRLDIKYNSYLFPDKYVDTVVLDLAIPDYVPPTLIFNKTDLSFSQALSTAVDGSINILLELLIEDISFIELNQSYDVCSNLTNVIYNDTQYQAFVFSELENNIYSTIEIDVRDLYNENTNFLGDDASINIFYTIIDNANNRNTITRVVNVERAFEYPEFLINGLTFEEFLLSLGGLNWSLSVQQGTIITDEMLLDGLTATDPASGGAGITINVENTLTDTNTPGVYEGVIIYTAISNKGVGITTTIRRDIIVTEAPVTEDGGSGTDSRGRFDGPCPCPIFYKPIQHNYKLGSGASNVMRLSRIILRR